MPSIISTTEIALFILLPLIIFYQRSNWTYRKYVANIAFLYIIWLFSYAALHELCHLFGSWITGTRISDFQLFPPYLKGDFKTAYVNSLFENKMQAIFSAIMPYFRDIVFLITGLLILKRKRAYSCFMVGLILMLFIFSPLFDIINNYSGFVVGLSGDFNEISLKVGTLVSHLIGLLFTLTAISITIRILKLFKNYPDLSLVFTIKTKGLSD